jgi:hypothetical protein
VALRLCSRRSPAFFAYRHRLWWGKRAVFVCARAIVGYNSYVRQHQCAHQPEAISTVAQTNRLYTETDDELRAEYDWSQLKGGVRGKYVQCYSADTEFSVIGRRRIGRQETGRHEI